MREFSFVSAWTLGVRFFSGKALVHAALLLGIGVLVPFVLQVALVEGEGGAAPPPVSAGGISALAAAGTAGALGVAALAVGYLLQVGSYFASWRLGLARGENPAAATLYGFIAALITFGGFFVLLVVLAGGLGAVSPALGIIAAMVAGLAMLATLFTTLAALVAVGVALLLGLAMLFGTAMGNAGMAATLVGGSGFIVVLLIVAAGVLLWLAGRLSCTTAILAERKSFNLFAAMAESWRLTWDDEWRIMRYLGLLGVGIALVSFGVAFAAGAGLAMLQGTPPSQDSMVALAAQLLVSIPFAYLSVLVPAGIYRELAGAPVAVDVFA